MSIKAGARLNLSVARSETRNRGACTKVLGLTCPGPRPPAHAARRRRPGAGSKTYWCGMLKGHRERHGPKLSPRLDVVRGVRAAGARGADAPRGVQADRLRD